MTSTLLHPKGYPLATCNNPLILTAIAKTKPKGLKLTVITDEVIYLGNQGGVDARCDSATPITFRKAT